MAIRKRWHLAVLLLLLSIGTAEAQAIIDVSPQLPTTSDVVRIGVADEGACIHYASSGPLIENNVILVMAHTIPCPPVPPPGILNYLLTVGSLPAGSYEVRFQVDGAVVDSRTFTVVAPATSLTLQIGRFAVGLSWTKPDGAPGGLAIAVQTSDDSGYFWLFDSADIDFVVKMVDGALVNGKKWVFGSSLTGQPVTLTVTDQIGTAAPCEVSAPSGACVRIYTLKGGPQSFTDFTAFPSN